ncbi:MAG: hypothetical protein JSU90_00575 [Nitrospiraceae bacterium]|nr:MAG: hypothetical protein JSU90_00575 [Nitrospiraceae bacterium]
MNSSEACEYRNDFLFFVLRPHRTASGPGFLYCSGVNIDRFLPITRGRHRPMSNPAIRGLQLVNLGVRALSLEKGAKPIAAASNDCAGETPGNDSWSAEHLIIEHAPPSLPREIVGYAVV